MPHHFDSCVKSEISCGIQTELGINQKYVFGMKRVEVIVFWKEYKMRKGFLDKYRQYSHWALPFPGRVRENVSTVQKERQKEVKNGFL